MLKLNCGKSHKMSWHIRYSETTLITKLLIYVLTSYFCHHTKMSNCSYMAKEKMFFTEEMSEAGQNFFDNNSIQRFVQWIGWVQLVFELNYCQEHMACFTYFLVKNIFLSILYGTCHAFDKISPIFMLAVLTITSYFLWYLSPKHLISVILWPAPMTITFPSFGLLVLSSSECFIFMWNIIVVIVRKLSTS